MWVKTSHLVAMWVMTSHLCLPIENMKQVQDALESISAQRTVPNVFINGRHVGGCDVVTNLYSMGDLARLLLAGTQERDSFAPGHSYDYDVVVIGGGSGGLACSKASTAGGALYGVTAAALLVVMVGCMAVPCCCWNTCPPPPPHRHSATCNETPTYYLTTPTIHYGQTTCI